MENITQFKRISDLSSLGMDKKSLSVANMDQYLLLLSHKQSINNGDNVNDFRYTSYNTSLYSIYSRLCGDLNENITEPFYEQWKTLSGNLVQLSIDLSTDISCLSIELLNDILVLSTNLSREIDDEILSLDKRFNDLSQELSTKFNNTVNWMISNFNQISNSISTNFNSLSTELSNWLSTNYCNWRNNLKDWLVSLLENYVTLNGDQTITGKKTFTEEIDGLALSAKWASKKK